MNNFRILLALLVCIGVSHAANTLPFSQVSSPFGTVSDSIGNVYVSSTTSNKVYQIDPETLIPVTFAGTGIAGNKDGNAYTTAQFNQPKGIAITAKNDLYVADYGNNAIRKISQGIVSTVTTDVTSPISLIILNGNSYEKANPLGIYVTQEDGQIIHVTEGPENDNCNGAIALGTLSSTPFIQYGSSLDATPDQYALCVVNGGYFNDYPESGVWYSFVGNGNAANITTCNSGTTSAAGLFIYRDTSPHDVSCTSLFCLADRGDSPCNINLFYETGTAIICTQVGITYYVVVDGGYEEGTFELRITDEGLTSNCASCTCAGIECGPSNCGGYCNDGCTGDTACINSTCVADAPNAQCTGAIALIGNTTVTADTKSSFHVSQFPQAGVCYNIYYTGLWYTYVGTGETVTLSTCSPETNFNTYLHVYQGSTALPCDRGLYCVDFSSYYYCGFHTTSASNVSFCALSGVTYYYYIEGNNVQNGNFQLTQTVSGPCTA